jgi:hypothetical protein
MVKLTECLILLSAQKIKFKTLAPDTMTVWRNKLECLLLQAAFQVSLTFLSKAGADADANAGAIMIVKCL